MSATLATLVTVELPDARDTLAPDGSEIRRLVRGTGTSLAHCRLPPGSVSRAVSHRTVEEVWYVLSGRGEVWRKQGDREEIAEVARGWSLNLPVGAHFQFRCTGHEALCLLIATTPPWPGDGEAVAQSGPWG
jgi:mannose-6-phosphate isomerase-like protein (cupin superfamily)